MDVRLSRTEPSSTKSAGKLVDGTDCEPWYGKKLVDWTSAELTPAPRHCKRNGKNVEICALAADTIFVIIGSSKSKLSAKVESDSLGNLGDFARRIPGKLG